MADVFISYSRENQVLVRRLAEAVKREGYSLWWDDELPPHRSYGDVITDEIGAAKAAIVVWSQSAAASEWVRAEADVARNQKKLIQVSIDERMPPLPFNQLHFVSIGDWKGEADHPGWRKVKESLAALCRPGTAAAPAHPMPAAPPPTAPPAPHKWHRLLAAVIAVSFLSIAGIATIGWMRAGESAPDENRIAAPAPAPAAPRVQPAPEPAPAPPRRAEARPEPRVQTPPREAAPANPRAMRRYCLGRGRATRQCAELRRRYLGN